jgi:hypothetical protein
MNSPLTLNHRTQKGPYRALEILILAWDRYKNVAGLNRLMGSQPSPYYTYDFYILGNCDENSK